MCAGPWHSVTWDHDGLPCGWHARRSLAADLDRDADELRRTTDAVLDHLATLFTEPYPFDSCDQIFVPGLNWGAQENPGCVTYRDEMLPRERTSDHLRGFRATVIAHEQAHMWFGNLVTMRWFEDTWLQESFADYLGYRVADDGAGFVGAQARHEIGRKPEAYVADERRSTHPVAPLAEQVPDVDAALANFDSISYAKGNSVLRQLATWLGDEAFLAGLNQHLTRHRFGNATLADFLAALDDTSDRDVRGWAEVWLRTAGFDTVSVDRTGDVPVLVRDGVRPHRFTVAAYDDRMRPRGERLVDVGEVPVALDDWADAVVVPNARGESFVRVRLDERSAAAVATYLSDVEDDLVRTVLWAGLLDRTETGDLDAEAYLELVARHLPARPTPPSWPASSTTPSGGWSRCGSRPTPPARRSGGSRPRASPASTGSRPSRRPSRSPRGSPSPVPTRTCSGGGWPRDARTRGPPSTRGCAGGRWVGWRSSAPPTRRRSTRPGPPTAPPRPSWARRGRSPPARRRRPRRPPGWR